MELDLVMVAIARSGDGRSIIGSLVKGGGLVRLVAPTPEGHLYPEHYRMACGAEPRPWDRILISAPWRDHLRRQPENRVVDCRRWELLERPCSRGVEAVAVNGDRSLLFGSPGRAIRDDGGTPAETVALITPEEALGVCRWHPESGRLKTRLWFRMGAVSYELPLTDAHFAARLAALGEGDFSLARMGCLAHHGLALVVTLGQPFHGWRYKMVAGLLAARHRGAVGKAVGAGGQR